MAGGLHCMALEWILIGVIRAIIACGKEKVLHHTSEDNRSQEHTIEKFKSYNSI